MPLGNSLFIELLHRLFCCTFTLPFPLPSLLFPGCQKWEGYINSYSILMKAHALDHCQNMLYSTESFRHYKWVCLYCVSRFFDSFTTIDLHIQLPLWNLRFFFFHNSPLDWRTEQPLHWKNMASIDFFMSFYWGWRKPPPPSSWVLDKGQMLWTLLFHLTINCSLSLISLVISSLVIPSTF